MDTKLRQCFPLLFLLLLGGGIISKNTLEITTVGSLTTFSLTDKARGISTSGINKSSDSQNFNAVIPNDTGRITRPPWAANKTK